MNDLEAALSASRPAIERALVQAEAELADLRVREERLQRTISRARLLLTDDPADPGTHPTQPMFLHDAMQYILKDHPDGLPPVTLLNEVRGRGLYRRRDGGQPDIGQIHARVHNYPHLFERDAGRIRLARVSDGTTSPSRRPG